MTWQPPDDWTRITTIDAHTAGEPLRIITGGLPPIPGDTILTKRRYAREHLDRLRTALMWEPRPRRHVRLHHHRADDGRRRPGRAVYAQ
jgi:trans-L-3-hydroxyproline dehydratase